MISLNIRYESKILRKNIDDIVQNLDIRDIHGNSTPVAKETK